MLGHGRGAGLDADRGEHLVGHAAHGRVADDGGQADDRHPRVRDGLAHARHREDGADADDGVGRREEHDVRRGDGLQDAGRGLGLLGADGDDGVRVHGGAQPHPVLLEVHGLAALVGVHQYVRLDAVVRHRKQPDARVPPLAQRLGHRAERVPGAEHLGADDVRGEVAVAEAEPLGPDAVRRQFLLDREGLPGPAPALLLVDATAEGVHHGVEVGTDFQAEEMDVVAGVPDDGDLRVGSC